MGRAPAGIRRLSAAAEARVAEAEAAGCAACCRRAAALTAAAAPGPSTVPSFRWLCPARGLSGMEGPSYLPRGRGEWVAWVTGRWDTSDADAIGGNWGVGDCTIGACRGGGGGGGGGGGSGGCRRCRANTSRGGGGGGGSRSGAPVVPVCGRGSSTWCAIVACRAACAVLVVGAVYGSPGVAEARRSGESGAGQRCRGCGACLAEGRRGT